MRKIRRESFWPAVPENWDVGMLLLFIVLQGLGQCRLSASQGGLELDYVNRRMHSHSKKTASSLGQSMVSQYIYHC